MRITDPKGSFRNGGVMQIPTVRELIDGSNNINRMSQEIHRVVTMIVGEVVYTRTRTTIVPSFKNGNNYVEVHGGWRAKSVKNDSGSTLVIEYLTEGIYTRDFGNFEQVAYSSNKKAPAYHVQKIYEALPVFIEGMLITFPEIGKRLVPYIEASGTF